MPKTKTTNNDAAQAVNRATVKELQDRLKAAQDQSEALRQQVTETSKRAAGLAEELADSRDSERYYGEESKEKAEQLTGCAMVIDLAIERQRLRANAGLAEYDAARAEIARLSRSPQFGLFTARTVIDRPGVGPFKAVA